jgi:hypothetical protein
MAIPKSRAVPGVFALRTSVSRETRHSVEKEEGLRQVGVQREESTKSCVQLVAYGAISRREGFGSKRHAGEEGSFQGWLQPP